MTPPNRIKQLRAAKGWTAERVSLAAGCSLTYVSKLERDERRPGLALARRIADALAAPLDEVFPPETTHGTIGGQE